MSEHLTQDDAGHWWNNDPTLLGQMAEYCRDDIPPERELYDLLPDPAATERKVWLADARINARGVHLDRAALELLAASADDAVTHANHAVARLTGGAATAVSQRAKLHQWLRSEIGTQLDAAASVDADALDEDEDSDPLPDLKRGTLERLLGDRSVPAHCREVMALRLDAGRTSTAKFLKLLSKLDDDNRLRDSLRYHGAATGRWTAAPGSGQLQNLPRPEKGDPDIEVVLATLREGGVPALARIGPPVSIMSRLLRRCITAAPGKRLIWADYNAIEARVLAWLAGQTDLVEAFARGDDVYRFFAGLVFHTPASAIAKDSNERQVGKTAVLGCGFMQGPDRFQAYCAGKNIPVDLELSERIVETYRDTYREISRYWFQLTGARDDAFADPGHVYLANQVAWKATPDRRWLRLRLPSGRVIHYPRPCMKPHEGRDRLHVWTRQARSFVPKPFNAPRAIENAVQAIARDLLAEAILRLEAAGYPVVLHIHDEIVVELPEGQGSVEEMERIMSEVPSWAAGLPIKVEGAEGLRYGK